MSEIDLLEKIIENQAYHTKLLESIFDRIDSRAAASESKKKLLGNVMKTFVGFMENHPGFKGQPENINLIRNLMEGMGDVN
ncbi:MAG: hypothetical protein RBQ87_01325 [Candidatus Cloacimonadaceae bacterium]|nr:hypothetical protein [Candidatus Cloacimonadaceae bacterium]